MKELIENINAHIDTFREECRKYTEENNQSAARRARKATLALEKLFKEFRKESLK